MTKSPGLFHFGLDHPLNVHLALTLTKSLGNEHCGWRPPDPSAQQTLSKAAAQADAPTGSMQLGGAGSCDPSPGVRPRKPTRSSTAKENGPLACPPAPAGTSTDTTAPSGPGGRALPRPGSVASWRMDGGTREASGARGGGCWVVQAGEAGGRQDGGQVFQEPEGIG